MLCQRKKLNSKGIPTPVTLMSSAGPAYLVCPFKGLQVGGGIAALYFTSLNTNANGRSVAGIGKALSKKRGKC